MKILIVDDELVSRKTLQKLLESVGECETAENGKDALTIAMSETPPDLVLLDIIMPEMDGFEVCRRLKAAPGLKDVPVIFLSANAEIKDITRGFELGAVDYITKPFHKTEVRARVETHLSLKKMREDLHGKNIVLEQQVEEIKEKTEQLRAKDLQLVEMDRIAGIGTLAAGIAHEINNPLGFLKSAMGFLKKSMNKILAAANYWDDKPLPEELAKGYSDYLKTLNFDHISNTVDKKFDALERGIERIMTIIKSLKRFSRVDMESIGNMNINESIDDAVEIFSTEETEKIEFIKEPGEIPSVECSASEINQCLLHLLTNAIDAVENEGRIVLKTSLDEAGSNIIIRITDNGKGMSPEVLRRSRSPFFTTKEVGAGTGVGLSMTEMIIKNHGGTMDISSAENEGTTVTLTLPVVGKAPQP